MAKLRKVVHVDDDEDIRTLTRMALELVGGYEVTQFGSGEETLRAIDGLDPQLMLLDFMMPGMSGLELWRALRARPGFEGIPAVFITAKSEHAFAEDLVGEGALAVIVKPFDISKLSTMVEEAWARHTAGA